MICCNTAIDQQWSELPSPCCPLHGPNARRLCMNGHLAKIPVVFLLWYGVACSEPPSTPSAKEPDATFDRQNSSGQNLLGVEREFAAVAESVPEFAGSYYDATGTLVVRLANASPGALERVIGQLQKRGRRVQPHVGRPALFRFSQLVEWRQAIRPLLPAGVYSLDL